MSGNMNLMEPMTLNSLSTAAAAVLMLGNTMQVAFNFNPKWLVLFFSMIVSIVLSYLYPTNYENLPEWIGIPFFTVLNGALIFLTAVGGNTIISPPQSPDQPNSEYGIRKMHGTPIQRQFWMRW